jgi:hypothetical protein
MPNSIKRCLVLALGVFAVAAPISAEAAAPEPGVTFDPNTPAGKEYVVPIVQGRADGSGSGNQKDAANTPFGIGIKPPGGGGGGGGGGRRAGHGHGSGDTNVPGPTGGTGSRVDPNLRSRIAHADEPGGTVMWTVGIGLAVVLLAGVLTLGLRRGRPEQPA